MGTQKKNNIWKDRLESVYRSLMESILSHIVTWYGPENQTQSKVGSSRQPGGKKIIGSKQNQLSDGLYQQSVKLGKYSKIIRDQTCLLNYHAFEILPSGRRAAQSAPFRQLASPFNILSTVVLSWCVSDWEIDSKIIFFISEGN